MKKIAKSILYNLQRLLYKFSGKKSAYAGDAGYFLKSHPQIFSFSYANWGSRRWEYPYVISVLNKIGIKDKQVIDIGIGLPGDSNFYQYYVDSGCFMTAYDIDSRLPEVTQLSPRCKILRQSASNLAENAGGSADVVVALSSFEHFPYPVFLQTIKELHRALKPGGDLIVTLDLTFDKAKSARWAILEKTFNNLPAEENDLPLLPEHTQLTAAKFMEIISEWFKPEDRNFYNTETAVGKRVYSPKWNSQIAYMHLKKVS